MDDAHHDPIHFHRVYSLQAVERPPQPPGSDDGKPGDDDGNPYTPALSSLASRRISADEASVRPSRQTLRSAQGDKRPASIPGLGWEKSLSISKRQRLSFPRNDVASLYNPAFSGTLVFFGLRVSEMHQSGRFMVKLSLQIPPVREQAT